MTDPNAELLSVGIRGGTKNLKWGSACMACASRIGIFGIFAEHGIKGNIAWKRNLAALSVWPA